MLKKQSVTDEVREALVAAMGTGDGQSSASTEGSSATGGDRESVDGLD